MEGCGLFAILYLMAVCSHFNYDTEQEGEKWFLDWGPVNIGPNMENHSENEFQNAGLRKRIKGHRVPRRHAVSNFLDPAPRHVFLGPGASTVVVLQVGTLLNSLSLLSFL